MNPPKSTTSSLGSLSLDSTPDAIFQVETLVEEISKKFKFKDDAFGNVMVAVTEAVNNAVHHGNKGDKNKKVTVVFELDGSYKLLVTVVDQGTGFDPDALPDPTAPENIDKLGGRGVFLMRQLSDDLTFTNQGREVTMAFRI